MGFKKVACISSVVILTTLSLSVAEDTNSLVLPLKMNPKGNYHRSFFVSLNGRDSGSLPFGSDKSRRLAFKYVDGKILPDRNFDGKFDKDDGSPLGKDDEFTMPVKVGSIVFDYPMRVMSVDKNWITFNISCFLEAGDGESIISFYDYVSNPGAFLAPGVSQIQIGDSPPMPFCETVVINGAIKNISLTEDGKALRISPYTGAASTLSLEVEKGWTADLTFKHMSTNFYFRARSGVPAALIPGKYVVAMSSAVFKGKDGKDELRMSGFPGKPTEYKFDAKSNNLKVGPPFIFEFDAFPSVLEETTIIIENIALRGRGGERYYATLREPDVLKYPKSYLRLGDKEVPSGVMEYG